MNEPNKALLRALDPFLQVPHPPAVAVLVGSTPTRLAGLLAAGCPVALVSRHEVALGESQLHVSLAASGPFDVVVDDTRGERGRLGLLRDAFFHVKPGGAYLVRGLRAGTPADDPDQDSLSAFVARVIEARARKRPPPGATGSDEQALLAAIGRVVLDGPHLLLTNRTNALAKMREDEMNALLDVRPDRGRVIESRPPLEFTAQCTVSESPSKRNGDMPTSCQVPAVSLREYHDVVCAPGAVTCQQNLLLPDTYRHNQKPRLGNRFTQELTPRFATPGDVSGAEPLSGAYFQLDSEFRGHFGHAMTEQLSRLWGWEQAKRLEPGLKAVMALNKGRELAGFEVLLYGAAGIARDDLVFVRAPVRVEKLLAATPMFSQPSYIHPDIRDLWAHVSRRLASSAPDREYPRKVFCARRTGKRPCHNAREVEALFDKHGFDVIYPEDFSLAEQAKIFREAEVIGGFAGSALFNLCLSESPKRAIMISSESYTAKNEYLIASVLGHHLDIVWCEPDVPREGGWSRRSFHSAFTLDLEREGEWLRHILGSL